MKIDADIDIDFADRDQALLALDHIPATIIKNGEFQRHASGVYFQDIPVNPITNLSAFEYEKAEQWGYFKVDFLNQSVYADIKSEDQLDTLLNTEPDWSKLSDPEFVKRLIHIHNHFDIVDVIKPISIEDLAIVLALIRPGKRYLLNRPRSVIDAHIWEKENNGYVFRKAHAISYAALVVIQMNLFSVRDDLISF